MKFQTVIQIWHTGQGITSRQPIFAAEIHELAGVIIERRRRFHEKPADIGSGIFNVMNHGRTEQILLV